MTTPSRQLRLPGSVAEVDASPEGPKIGAFFDLDGTLVAGYTVAAVTKDRLRRREVGATEFVHMMQLALEYRLGRHQFENVIEGAVRSTKGRLAEDVEEMGERIFQQAVADLIYPEMRELVRAHQRRGHTVVLSSSALTMQAEPVARYLGIDHVVCNRFVVDELGILTGELQRPVIWGTSKATSVQRFAAEHQVDLRSSYFYADGDEDLALMHLVGNPRPTNPGPGLTKVAERRGWPILRFSSRGGGGTLGTVRGLATIGSLGPVAAGAVSLGLLTRNKRSGVNFLTRYWPEVVLAVNGVKLNVTGEENLTARRPAVFLFNHRNNFDVFIVAALVKENWTAVAKKEAREQPARRPAREAARRRVHRPGRHRLGGRRPQAHRGGRAQGPVDPGRAGGNPDGHPVGRPVQEGRLPDRDGHRPAGGPDRHQELRIGGRPQLQHAPSGHGRRRGPAAGQPRGLDAGQPARADRADPGVLRGAAGRLVRGGTGRPGTRQHGARQQGPGNTGPGNTGPGNTGLADPGTPS